MASLSRTALFASFVGCLSVFVLVGCKNLPGGSKDVGTAATTEPAAVDRALADREKRGRGTLIEGLVGPGGGYLIGVAAKNSKAMRDSESAKAASDRARDNPASPGDVSQTSSADINGDGFVTMDEVIAMQKAGLGEEDLIDRLRRADQDYELTDVQERYLADRGVSQRVIRRMEEMNKGSGSTPANSASGK